MIRQFLAVMKTNYMSIKRDEGVTTWARVADELKDTIRNNNEGNMLGVDGYAVDAFIETLLLKRHVVNGIQWSTRTTVSINTLPLVELVIRTAKVLGSTIMRLRR